jgi:ATP-dependent DNA helicase PIF1
VFSGTHPIYDSDWDFHGSDKKKKKKKKSKKSSKRGRKNNHAEPTLCPEQEALVNLILSGRNVFFTGSAGCGKSTVLKAAVRELRNRGKKVRIVAPTGRAAVDIGGQTIHAFAGITPDSLKLPLEKLRAISHGRILYERFKETEVLIIDEISMVENHLLERLNAMLKASRDIDKPFGGIQVVMLGDFYQCTSRTPYV